MSDNITPPRYAVIIDGIIDNVVLWDGETSWTSPAGAVLESLADWPEVGIGWGYNAKATVNRFTPPEEDTDGDD